MINGGHIVIFSSNPEADRNFFLTYFSFRTWLLGMVDFWITTFRNCDSSI
jgi:hypothetical protein